MIAVCFAAGNAYADTIRASILKTGTVSWEFNVIHAHGLAKAAGLTIDTTQLGSPQAGKVALRGGSADVIVSDWLWVSRERDLGAKLVFYPYSTTLGAVMVPAKSPIHTLADLKGKTLGVAGGPIDKSWLLLQALAKRQGIDLKKQARVVYGAAPLLAAKLQQGELDAMLNFWNFCARLETQGYRRLIGVEDMLPKFGVTGPLAMIGYVFDGTFAAKHPDTVARFLAVTHKAKQILATSDAEWKRIAPLVHAKSDAALKIYRGYYRAGIPKRPIAEEEADARTLYSVLAKLGGKALVGDSKQLAPGTFYRPPAAK
jgi:NitT/TauT family transport system substrate-binding protein